jgi:hypothetical protein
MVWNILGNGYSPSFRTANLLWSLNLAPEVRGVLGQTAEMDFVINSRMDYTQRFLGKRLEINANMQVGAGVASGLSAVLESNVGTIYHWLIPYGPSSHRTSHLISFGLTGGMAFWPTQVQLLSPLNGRGIFVSYEDDPVKVRGHVTFFIETSLGHIRLR